MILFSGSSNEPLAQKVANILQIPLGNRELIRFADGEIRPWIQDDVRDKTVFLLQSFSQPMNDYIMETILIADAIRRGAPKRLVGIIPYFGYARQDKQHRFGEPVSARVIAKILEVVALHEVMTIDLHNDAIVGFFRIPVDHLSALPVLASHIQSLSLSNAVIVSPDVGGLKRARNLTYLTDMPLIVMEKKRHLDKTDTSQTYQIIGDAAGKTAILIDDIISTGGTIINAVKSLHEAGVKKIYVVATHGVLANNAISTLQSAPIEQIIVTDTISHQNLLTHDKFFEVSIAPIIAESIKTIMKL